ncbi:MAG: hypothetical protein ACJ8KU_11355 [Chthoniobacterales bacterium]
MKPEERARTIAEIIRVLHAWGIHSLGQFAALEKQNLAARLGPLAVELWERVNGRSNRVLKRVRPIEIFEEEFEFENEIETAEPLLFMLRRFLEQLAMRLGATYHVAKELTLRIVFSHSSHDRATAADKAAYEHTFKIPQPTNDVELLFRMLYTHLENFRSEASITAVALRAEPAAAGTQQFGLFETALRNPAQLAETLARLTALVGSDRAGTPRLIDTHEPDRFRMEPFEWCTVESAAPRGRNGRSRRRFAAESSGSDALRTAHTTGDGRVREASLRPAFRRFRDHGAAAVLVDEGKPAHIRSAELTGSIMKQNGPFLSSGNWWDENAWRRAEWDVEFEDEVVCRCHCDGAQWRVDGVYD